MSGYRNEWDCCGDETYTQAWEPEVCPFCEVNRLESERDRLMVALENVTGQLESDDENSRCLDNITSDAARKLLIELKEPTK